MERTFAWLNQFRRLRVRYDKRADIHEAVLSENSAEPSCGSVVVPQQPTEQRAATDRAVRRSGRFRHDQPVLQALVIPLPVIVLGEGDKNIGTLRAQAAGDPGSRTRALEATSTAQGITVEHVGDLDGAHGTLSGGRIQILNGLAPAAEFSVLVHEYAHLCAAVGYVWWAGGDGP